MYRYFKANCLNGQSGFCTSSASGAKLAPVFSSGAWHDIYAPFIFYFNFPSSFIWCC